MAVRGGLEQTVVQDVPQRFGQGAEHLLLGLPHRGVRVEPQTFLPEGREETQISFEFMENWLTGTSKGIKVFRSQRQQPDSPDRFLFI